MNKKEFRNIRQLLGKTQSQLASILCVSGKAIQSFEQGWRHIPPYIERQMLFLWSLRRSLKRGAKPCWEIRDCPDEWRKKCIVWELRARYFCWFINGTFCTGQMHDSWKEKMAVCRTCEVFRSIMEEMKK